ncbi:hypothetical protein [uncultured Cellulomonas sp.]|uniref:hypothetical protein n=1 Tax=uncultured Cellulomonas sp. TaxID=189682 RepID=UPI00261CEF48|nr:hypothetical protein [uncultured Cellulomonas sp.]
MSSAARAAFVDGMAAFTTALSEPAVTAQDGAGAFLRRGLTVAAYNLLENFVDDRLTELASHVNAGPVQFLDLPDKLQRRAIQHTLDVATARLRRQNVTTAEMRQFSSGLGQNLTAVGAALSVSPFTWAWPGSNLGAADIAGAMSHFWIDGSWETVRGVAGRIGFTTTNPAGQNLDLAEEFRAISAERNSAAHQSIHPITSLWLRALPERLMRLAVPIDLLLSCGAHALHNADATLLAGRKWNASARLKLRFVDQRASDHATFKEAAKRATAKGPDGVALFTAACVQASDYEAVVRRDRVKQVVTWALPCAD